MFECAYTWLIQTSARRPLPQLWSESLCQREPTAPAHHHPAVGKQEPVVECEDCVNKRTTVCLYMVLSNSCQFSGRLHGHRSTPGWFKKKNPEARKKNVKPWNVGDVWHRCHPIMWLSLKTKRSCRRHSTQHKRSWVEERKIIMQPCPGLVPSDRYYNNSITRPCANPLLSLNTSAEKILTALCSRLIHPGTTVALSKQYRLFFPP